ncbi:ABC-2 type transport system permease protein [Ferrimonas sediminum]|uniref:Transport permease protein n=1 Tax=Ferrimonas sediminum TaxID=718193 RepID=A0A1G8LWB4_9GAMM|nr:ABC transporter permease [Ferrimonas sediminum]SDI60004.1 ABC-2 type transport system permease protein [Ferrimonas sediminum]
MKSLLALIHARNLEFVRDRSALGWSLMFPLMLIIGFGVAFSDTDRPEYKLGVLGAPAYLAPLQQTRYLQLIPYEDEALARSKVGRHQLDLLLTEGGYVVNPDSVKGYLAERIVLGVVGPLASTQEQGQAVRYIDWLMPGIIGMNMMFSGLYGVGYVIIRYRKNGVLKRYQATPMKPWIFILSQICSRMLMMMATATLVFVACSWMFSIAIVGSLLLLLITALLGALALVSVGLLVACRTRSEEFGNGVLNLIAWPMMFLSGVWFSLEGTAEWIQSLARLLPLSHLNAASRAIIIDGAGVATLWPHWLALAAISVVAIAIGAKGFRWN